ncbi:hypothetical protein N7493_003325 [Penicillium malachiteum]|uniref:FAD/NAD(P)-binding domain-containing protein n=1 Tax=Penicillium malachiteum TaxID=1324776 RepID=A0AAD6HPG8_9EURO|nr:hypothetical protein N7493_003325 [Penicillium malachiteum]
MTSSPLFDAIVVGAGFSGIRMLCLLRENGFNVRGIECSQGLGGVWHTNRYPGARCDSPQPFYQIHDDVLASEWAFSERFPGHEELWRYFQYVESKRNVEKDFDFGVSVVQASFNEYLLWSSRLSDRRCLTTRWFIPAVGLASMPSMPEIKGIDQFQKELYHTANWPLSGISCKDKRVAVLGTGPSAARMISNIASEVKSLTIYQRTPVVVVSQSADPDGTASPHISPLTAEGARAAFKRSPTSASGFEYSLQDPQSLARAKISDPAKADILVPSKLPYPILTKRPCFMDYYYESLNRPNVELVDVNKEALVEITTNGIQSGTIHRDFDLFVCATGFEAPSSAILKLNITGKDGLNLADAWNPHIKSYMGMAVPGFPNMFYLFGPQSATVRINVPTAIECQAQWILSILKGLRDSGIKCCEPSQSAARSWVAILNSMWDDSLYSEINGWETRGVTQKPEPLWVQGIQKYNEHTQQCRAPEFRGFVEVQPMSQLEASARLKLHM